MGFGHQKEHADQINELVFLVLYVCEVVLLESFQESEQLRFFVGDFEPLESQLDVIQLNSFLIVQHEEGLLLSSTSLTWSMVF